MQHNFNTEDRDRLAKVEIQIIQLTFQTEQIKSKVDAIYALGAKFMWLLATSIITSIIGLIVKLHGAK